MYDTYSPEAEYADSMAFESAPYSFHAEADREAHYLFQAGFVSSCSCHTCEGRAEAAAQEEIDRAAWESMSREEQDAVIAAEEAWKAERDALAAAGDPFAWDELDPAAFGF